MEAKRVMYKDAICFMRNLNASHVQDVSMLSLHLAFRMELNVLAVSSESRLKRVQSLGQGGFRSAVNGVQVGVTLLDLNL
ncbi:hypothetical protein NC651_004702 [Populus alba x Populus x berolinensis]|nr:hypothetical protein NC651_004702 [Populus alba x Populus x berolinensis]